MNNLRLLLIGLWLGAAFFFSATVAPAVFVVLRNLHLSNANEIAGTIVTRLLTAVNISGFAISIFLLLTAVFFRRVAARGLFYAETILLALIAILTAISQWFISPRMVALRASLPAPIDQISLDDPRRMAFDNLHHYSVALLGVAMLASLIAFFIIARRQPKA